MTEREVPASIDAGGERQVDAQWAELAAAGTELAEGLDAFRAALALARDEPVESSRLQALFEGLGVRIGRMVAQQIRGGNAPRVEELVASTVQSAEVVELLSAAVLSFEGVEGVSAGGGGASRALQPGRAGRRRRRGEPPPPCGNLGCGRPSRTRGFCQTHYVQWLRANRLSPA